MHGAAGTSGWHRGTTAASLHPSPGQAVALPSAQFRSPSDFLPKESSLLHNNICTPKSSRIDHSALLQPVDERAAWDYISVHSAGTAVPQSYEHYCVTLPTAGIAPRGFSGPHCSPTAAPHHAGPGSWWWPPGGLDVQGRSIPSREMSSLPSDPAARGCGVGF